MAIIKQIIHKETEQPIKIVDIIKLLMKDYQLSLDSEITDTIDEYGNPIKKDVAVIKYINNDTEAKNILGVTYFNTDATTIAVLDMKDMVLITNTLASKIRKE